MASVDERTCVETVVACDQTCGGLEAEYVPSRLVSDRVVCLGVLGDDPRRVIILRLSLRERVNVLPTKFGQVRDLQRRGRVFQGSS